jgi:UDP-2,3-diacylglucosamine pyrophosphatase LpxH
LDEALRRAGKQEALSIHLMQDKFIIFSDLHKGGHDGADDFRVCERAYNAALAYYYRQGYTLVALGDVEELWEERPQKVIKKYAHSLRLEGEFHKAKRYLRFWGNHDDDWNDPKRVNKLLLPALVGKGNEAAHPLHVRETLIARVLDGGEQIGTIFFAHGHQGTNESDKYAWISKPFVRYIWRPIQRIIKFSFNTPAQDLQLRHAHDSAMYFWSAGQSRTILIAGHTHRPVFRSKSHMTKVREELDAVDRRRAKNPDDLELRKQGAELSAELEWIMAQNQQAPGEAEVIELKKPSYFNTGCCAFYDGDITGLEIAEGEIRLVRWPNDEKQPKPKVMASISLRKVFEECQ